MSERKYEGSTFWISESDVRFMEQYGAKSCTLRPTWRPAATIPVTFGRPRSRDEAAAVGTLTTETRP